jgi:hypothetical protein
MKKYADQSFTLMLSMVPYRLPLRVSSKRGSVSGGISDPILFFAEFEEDSVPMFLCQVHEPTPFVGKYTILFTMNYHIYTARLHMCKIIQ